MTETALAASRVQLDVEPAVGLVRRTIAIAAVDEIITRGAGSRMNTTVVLALGAAGCLSACAEAPQDPMLGPERLSETGLYADFSSRTLTSGIIPIKPRFALWSDGAEKRRYLLLPPGGQINSSDMDAWRFPVGTRVWKEFQVDGKLIETRILEKRRDPDDGGWFQMAYAWNDEETEATAVPKGVKDAKGTGYEIPSQAQCGNCHYKGEKPLIGISAMQLSTDDSGGESESMIALRQANALTQPPARTFQPPGDGTVRAALGYLHGNCSHCHDSRSAAAPEVKIFMELKVDDATPEGTSAYRALVGQPIHHFPDVGQEGLVVPGKPDKSLVYYRMSRRDEAQMPPLMTRKVDDAGLVTISAWISALAPQ
jgi:hypothetical protein